jgi:hypothetical protein
MFSGRGGPWVEDCRFEAIGDDNLIIKGFRAHCINIVDACTFDLVHGAGRFNRNIFGVVTASVNWPVGQWDIEETGLREVRNLWIENNQFINWWQNPAISVNNGLHVRISGNSFTLDEYYAQTALTGLPIAIKVVNSTDVRVEDNTLGGPGLNLEDGIKLIDSGAVIVRDNREMFQDGVP